MLQNHAPLWACFYLHNRRGTASRRKINFYPVSGMAGERGGALASLVRAANPAKCDMVWWNDNGREEMFTAAEWKVICQRIAKSAPTAQRANDNLKRLADAMTNYGKGKAGEKK